jgi:probable F420-dependent oxidoreductase
VTKVRTFRFGVQEHRAPSAKAWKEKAREVESLGYATLYLPDHFTDQVGPIAALMAAADATTTLRVGSLVFDNDYRHPVVLAKEAATLDLLSEGRLDLGLGAGWMASDYEQAGIPFDSAGTRISRMEEALTIIKGLFTGEPFTFAGEHYRLTSMEGSPRPVQRPHPPILLGGGGRRMLRIAAREADIVNVNFDLREGAVNRNLVRTDGEH